MRHSARYAVAGLLLAVLCWSGNALVARAFAGQIPPFTLSFWRWTLALSLLLPFVAKPLWQHRRELQAAGWRLLVLAAVGIAGYNSMLYAAAQTTAAINITLVNTCLPLMTFIGAGVLLGEWPQRRAWLGLGVAAIGLLVLISRASWTTLSTLSFNHGDLIMLLAVADWALYSLLLRRWASYLQAIPPLALLGVLMLLGVPLILPLYLYELSQGALRADCSHPWRHCLHRGIRLAAGLPVLEPWRARGRSGQGRAEQLPDAGVYRHPRLAPARRGAATVPLGRRRTDLQRADVGH